MRTVRRELDQLTMAENQGCVRKEGARTRKPSCKAETLIRDLAAIPIAHSVSNIGDKGSQ
jgi:hypothetical protein